MTTRRSASLLVACWLACGVLVTTQSAPQLNANDVDRVRAMLKQAYETVKSHYYDPTFQGLDWDARYKAFDARIEAMPHLPAALSLIAGLLDGLNDSHTSFQPPQWSKRTHYGYDVGFLGDVPHIVGLTRGSDAARKLAVGDRIESINGNPVARETFRRMRYILDVLTPQLATTLVVRSGDGPPRTVRVESKVTNGRALTTLGGAGTGIFINEAIREMEDLMQAMQPRSAKVGDVLIWKLPGFMIEPAAINRIISQSLRHSAVVLDLRGNPGGLIDALTALVGGMFPKDVTVGTRMTRAGRDSLTARSRGDKAYAGRLVVLIDSASGSSAELFARVVQLEHRGLVLGDRSAGEVRESRLLPFTHGTDVIVAYAVAVTTADLLMSDGVSLERRGVTPDVPLVPSAADLAAGRDPVLAEALNRLGSSIDPAAAGRLFRKR